jgi:hypothetical protein
MPFYRCLANGQNFPGTLLDAEGKVGFYTTRWVQALNPRAAELKAMAMLRREPLLSRPDARSPDARVFFDEVVRIDKLPLRRGMGLTLYAYDERAEPKPIASERIRERIANLRRP